MLADYASPKKEYEQRSDAIQKKAQQSDEMAEADGVGGILIAATGLAMPVKTMATPRRSAAAITATRGHYLKPFARLLLAVAALRDGNRKEAHDTLAGLCQGWSCGRAGRADSP